VFTDDVPTYTLDLSLPEAERWREVIARESTSARKLAQQALDGIGGYAALGGAFKWAYRLSGGRYGEEMKEWARATGLGEGELVLANCSYELSHAAAVALGKWSSLLGCTAGVRNVRGLGMVHVRNLDWPLPAFGEATRIFKFRSGRREFMTVGLCGFVGALSGMVPGAYSVTINYAPPVGLPSFQFGPAFLLREVLEECDTYAEAVRMLRDTPLSTSVFFTVCGAKKDEACIIERTSDDAAVRRMKGNVLVQANHHVARKFSGNNAGLDEAGDDDEPVFATSCERAETLKRELSRVGAGASPDDVASSLDLDPVLNDDTGQQMVFVPKTGAWRVWRWVERRRARPR
jgi:acid ceramidase